RCKMFRILRWLLSLAATAGLLWAAYRVPLGKHTLFGHVRAIFGTQEAKDLAEGTEQEAEKVAERVRNGLHKDGGKDGGAATATSSPNPPPPLAPARERRRKV